MQIGDSDVDRGGGHAQLLAVAVAANVDRHNVVSEDSPYEVVNEAAPLDDIDTTPTAPVRGEDEIVQAESGEPRP